MGFQVTPKIIYTLEMGFAPATQNSLGQCLHTEYEKGREGIGGSPMIYFCSSKPFQISLSISSICPPDYINNV